MNLKPFFAVAVLVIGTALTQCGAPPVPNVEIIESGDQSYNPNAPIRHPFPEDGVVCYTWGANMQCVYIGDQPR